MSDPPLHDESYDGLERRIFRRRRVVRPVDVIIRRGTLGLGPNLALALIDVSEEGLRVRLKGPVVAGDEVEICLSFPIASKSWKFTGDVRWCESGPFETFLAGISLRRQLTHLELAELT